MLPLLLALVSQTANVEAVHPIPPATVSLSGANRTSIGGVITARWPSASAANLASFHCERRPGPDALRFTGDDQVWCNPCERETLTQSTLFSLVSGGESAIRANSSARVLCHPKQQITGANLTTIGSVLSATHSGVSTSTMYAWGLTQADGSSTVFSVVNWAEPLTAAQMWTAYQAGRDMVPVR